MVISSLKGRKNTKVSYTARTAELRQQTDDDTRENSNIAALAVSLMPNALGLRRVDQEHVAEIKKSLEDYGFHGTAPIIIDDRGRILSGRHRLEVREMWRREKLKGLNDREAVQIAMASAAPASGQALIDVDVTNGDTFEAAQILERKRVSYVFISGSRPSTSR